MYTNDIIAIDNTLKTQITDTYLLSNNDFIYCLDKDFKLIAANQNFLLFIKPITKHQSIEIGDHLFEAISLSVELEKRYKESILRGLNGETYFDEIHFQIPEREIDRWSEMLFNPIVNNNSVIGVTIISRDIELPRLDLGGRR
jgi:hypothetical protein